MTPRVQLVGGLRYRDPDGCVAVAGIDPDGHYIEAYLEAPYRDDTTRRRWHDEAVEALGGADVVAAMWSAVHVGADEADVAATPHPSGWVVRSGARTWSCRPGRLPVALTGRPSTGTGRVTAQLGVRIDEELLAELRDERVDGESMRDLVERVLRAGLDAQRA